MSSKQLSDFDNEFLDYVPVKRFDETECFNNYVTIFMYIDVNKWFAWCCKLYIITYRKIVKK